jgi:hypothetical protein
MLAAIVGTVTGSPTPTISYQWNRNGTPITTGTGYNAANYLLQSADVGDAITVTVTASNSAGSASSTSAATAAITAATASLHVNTTGGVAQVLTAAGAPFLAKFETVWGQLDGVTNFTDNGGLSQPFGTLAYNAMSTTISQLTGKGVNGVRYRLSAGYYNGLSTSAQATYVSQVAAWATSVTNAGMYFQPCLWDGEAGQPYAGGALASSYTSLKPLILAVLAAIGTSNPLILWEPINEPNSLPVSGNDGGFGAWQTIMEYMVTTFRTAGYMGVLVIDPPSWANSGSGGAGYSDSYYSTLEAFDASTLGVAQHQIVFAKHDYADEYSGMTWSDAAWQAAVGGSQTKHAIWETEFGYQNGATSTESSSWAIAGLQDLATKQASMTNFCGVSGFIEAWVDDNSMTTLGSFNAPTAWGTDWKTYYLNPGGLTLSSVVASVSGSTATVVVHSTSDILNISLLNHGTATKATADQTPSSGSATFTVPGLANGSYSFDAVGYTVASGQSGGSSTPTVTSNTITVAVAAAAPAFSTLVEAFNETTIPSEFTATSAVTIGGGRAALPVASAYSKLYTNAAYNLTGSSASAQITPPAAGNGSRQTNLELSVSQSSSAAGAFGVGWQDTNGGQLTCYYDNSSGVQTRLSATVPWTTGAAVYVRISESGGTITFSYWSGTAWTTIATVAWASLGFAITAMYLDVYAGYYGTETASTAYVANVNVAPATTGSTLTLSSLTESVSGSTVTISVGCSSDLQNVTFQQDSGTPVNVTPSGGSASHAFTGVASGSHTYSVIGFNTAPGVSGASTSTATTSASVAVAPTTPPTVPLNATNSGTATAATFAAPSGLTSGMLLVATVQVDNPSDAATLTPASGWTLVSGSAFHQTHADTTSDKWQVATFIKTSTGETGTETVCSWTGSAGFAANVAVLSGIATSSPVDLAAVYSTTAAATSIVAAGLNTITANDTVLAVVCNDQGQTYGSGPAGWTTIVDVTGFAAFYKTVATAGQMASTTFGASGSCDQTVTMIAVKPGAGGSSGGSSSGTLIGLNFGYWTGSNLTTIINATTPQVVRLDYEFFVSYYSLSQLSATIATMKSLGIAVNLLFSDYTRSASTISSFVSANPGISYVEIGNENLYSYQSPTTTIAANVALATKAAFQALPTSVKVLCQADIGGGGNTALIAAMYSAVPSLHNYCAGWVAHPYGQIGADSDPVGILSQVVSLTNAQGAPSNFPIYVTEYGIATDNGNAVTATYDGTTNYGRSLTLTYAQAASALTNTYNQVKVDYPQIVMWTIYQECDQSPQGSNAKGQDAHFGACYFTSGNSTPVPKPSYAAAIAALVGT